MARSDGSKISETRSAELRQAIAASKGGRPDAHVPVHLRKRAREMMAAGRVRGVSREEIAAALGIHPTTLFNWQRQVEAPKQKRFVRARIVAKHEAKVEKVATPSYHRICVTVIDGLDVAALAALLRGGS